jgi:hypothetical protein
MTAVYFYTYIYGFLMSNYERRLRWWQFALAAVAQVTLIPAFALFETISVVYSFFRCKSDSFHIVQK